jgi:hypothetical protein
VSNGASPPSGEQPEEWATCLLGTFKGVVLQATRRVILLALALCCVASAAFGASTASAAKIVPLEGLSYPIAVNSHDQVIGSTFAETFNGPAFWSEGKLSQLKRPAGLEYESSVSGLNDSGTAVGTSCAEYRDPCEVVTWTNGGSPVIPFYAPHGPISTRSEQFERESTAVSGLAIDDAGDIGGAIHYDVAEPYNANEGFYAAGGADPRALGTEAYELVAVSAHGDLGISEGALTYSEFAAGATGPATVSKLCVEPEHSVSMASDGSYVGNLLVGEYEGAPNCTEGTHAPFLHTPNGQLTQLPLGSASSGYATGVNESHMVVGVLGSGVNSRAVLWPAGGQPVELDSLLPAGSPWVLTHASAINNDGVIVGEGEYEGKYKSFLLETGANALTASIQLSAPEGAPLTGKATAVGATLVATVTVTASATDKQAVTAIAADPSLQISPSTSLTQLSGPSPMSIDGSTLQPGQSFTYTDTYRIAGTGHVTASVAATGTYEGLGVTGNASATAPLGQPLEVSVAWLKGGQPLVLEQPGQKPQANTLKLADEEHGEIPQDVTARVTVTNTSGITEENVSLNGIPALSYHNAGDARQALPVGVTAGPKPGANIGTLAPGESAEVEFTVHVTNNGVFDFSPQVLSSDAGSSGTSVSQGVGTLTVLPSALLWVSLHRVGTGLVRAGADVEISGTVTNRSLSQTIEVDPLEPNHEGNAGEGALVSDTVAPLPDGVQLPFDGKVGPGETVDVSGNVATAVIPETLGKVVYEPSGEVIGAGGVASALTASQIGMSPSSGEFAIGVESGEPAYPAATTETILDNFTDATIKGTSQWLLNELSAGATLLAHPITGSAGIVKGIAGFAVGSAQAVKDAASLVGAVYVLSVAGQSMTDEEKGAFAEQIVSDFKASHLGGDYGVIAGAASRALGAFTTAVEKGDYNQVAALAGGTFATGLTSVEDAVLSDVIFQKLALGVKYAGKAAAAGASGELANAIVLADSIRDAKAASVLGKGIEGVEAGTNLLLDSAAALRNSFGLTSKQITELRNYCERSKIIVAVRARGSRAAELIKEGLAVGKNEIIKLKAVNSYDVDFLGYSKHDLNTVVWAQPLPEHEVVDELLRKKASAETEKIVLERLRLREKEWNDAHIRELFEDSSLTKSIDWSFDGSGNGAPGANKAQMRRFELKSQPSPVAGTGRTYEQVLVGNKPGLGSHARLVPITQDVDVMAILSADGSILSAAERVDAYIHLSDILGIEHGETPTWIKDGEIMFQAKAKQLADVVKGGEPLAVFAPTGNVTAGFFNPALTIFDNVTKGGRIFFEGGYNNPTSKLKTSIQLALQKMV